MLITERVVVEYLQGEGREGKKHRCIEVQRWASSGHVQQVGWSEGHCNIQNQQIRPLLANFEIKINNKGIELRGDVGSALERSDRHHLLIPSLCEATSNARHTRKHVNLSGKEAVKRTTPGCGGGKGCVEIAGDCSIHHGGEGEEEEGKPIDVKMPVREKRRKEIRT